MKRKWLVGICILLVSISCKEKSTGKNGVVYTNALQYNNYILDRQTALKNLVNKLLLEKDTSLKTAENTLQTAIHFTNKCIGEIQGMPDWKGNIALRDSSILLFQFYQKTLSEDFKHLMTAEEDNKLTPMETSEYQTVSERVYKQQHQLDSGLLATQQKFALQNGFSADSTAR